MKTVFPASTVPAMRLMEGAASLELAMTVARQFGIANARAKEIAAEVAAAVTTWRYEARQLGISGREIERMSSAFEHEDLEAAKG